LAEIKSIGTIHQAKNGQEAFDLVQENEKLHRQNNSDWFYDLIFLDLDMPIMNGYEAVQKINKTY
jgi:CheY-like chemotaxis protein